MSNSVTHAKPRNLFQLLQSREGHANISGPANVGSIGDDSTALQVWAVRNPDAMVSAWASHLTKRLSKDKSWRSDTHYSRLIGVALRALKKPDFAHIEVESSSFLEEGGRPGSLYSHESAALFIVDASGTAIGYVVYELKWNVSRLKRGRHELEVNVEEVWIEPAYRNQGLGRILAMFLVGDVRKHLTSLDKQLPNSANPTFFDVLYTGEVYSTSGEQFLDLCALEHDGWLIFDDDKRNLKERDVSFLADW